VRCRDPHRCLSSVLKINACLLNDEQDPEEIPFQNIYNGITEHVLRDNHEREYSEELRCEDWFCNNICAVGDGYSACSDGRDENKLLFNDSCMCIASQLCSDLLAFQTR
jgi:hypothetical protein